MRIAGWSCFEISTESRELRIVDSMFNTVATGPTWLCKLPYKDAVKWCAHCWYYDGRRVPSTGECSNCAHGTCDNHRQGRIPDYDGCFHCMHHDEVDE